MAGRGEQLKGSQFPSVKGLYQRSMSFGGAEYDGLEY